MTVGPVKVMEAGVVLLQCVAEVSGLYTLATYLNFFMKHFISTYAIRIILKHTCTHEVFYFISNLFGTE